MTKEKPAEENNIEGSAPKKRSEESVQEEELAKLLRELGKRNQKEKEDYKRKKPRN